MMKSVDRQQTPARTAPLSRRQFLRRAGLAGVGLAALPLLAACGTEPTPTTVPTRPVPTTAPTAAAAATIVAGTAVPPPPIGSPGAAGAAGPTMVPPSPTSLAGIPRAKSSATVVGKYLFIQNQDFHPDHNAFLRAEIEKYCKVQGWDLGISYAAGFQGGGDLLTTLVGAVQAGNAPDAFFHDLGVRQYQSQGVLEPVTAFTKEMIGKYGATYPGFEDTTFFDNEW